VFFVSLWFNPLLFLPQRHRGHEDGNRDLIWQISLSVFLCVSVVQISFYSNFNCDFYKTSGAQALRPYNIRLFPVGAQCLRPDIPDIILEILLETTIFTTEAQALRPYNIRLFPVGAQALRPYNIRLFPVGAQCLRPDIILEILLETTIFTTNA